MPDDASEGSEGFTVRDRRRFTGGETAPADETPVAEPEDAAPRRAESPAADPFPGSEPTEEDYSLPDVHTVLAMFLGELRNLAWLRMGLVANPQSGQMERDMAQAKVAIDTVAFLAQQIEPVVPAEERLPLRALVSDLQINYVEQSKRG